IPSVVVSVLALAFVNVSAQAQNGVTNSTQNPNQLAILHWYQANLTTQVPVGTAPFGLACDGVNMWVANFSDNTVTKLGPDGTVLGTFPVGSKPWALAFDGASIWVTNRGDGTVSRLRASYGAALGTFPVGTFPLGVAFDGVYIWVANSHLNTVSVLR